MDNLANVVLLTLPYIAASPKKLNAALDSVVDRLTTYMDSRDTNETSFIKPFKSAHPDVSPHLVVSDISRWPTIRLCTYYGFKSSL